MGGGNLGQPRARLQFCCARRSPVSAAKTAGGADSTIVQNNRPRSLRTTITLPSSAGAMSSRYWTIRCGHPYRGHVCGGKLFYTDEYNVGVGVFDWCLGDSTGFRGIRRLSKVIRLISRVFYCRRGYSTGFVARSWTTQRVGI